MKTVSSVPTPALNAVIVSANPTRAIGSVRRRKPSSRGRARHMVQYREPVPALWVVMISSDGASGPAYIQSSHQGGSRPSGSHPKAAWGLPPVAVGVSVRETSPQEGR